MLISSKRVFNNTSWLMCGQIINMLLQFLISLATARYLGAYNFGTINYVAAYVNFFVQVVGLGLAAVVIKELATSDNNSRSNELIWTCNFMRFIAAIISAICVVAIVFFADNGDMILVKIAVLSSISLLFNAFDSTNYYFIAKLLSKWYTIASVIGYLAMSAYRVILLILGADVLWFAFATTVDAIVLNVLLMVFYAKFEGFKPRFNLKLGWSLLKQSYHYLIAGLITVLYAQVDKIMLGKMTDNSMVGLYSITVTIAALWSVIPSSLIHSITSVLYETAKQSKEAFLRRLRQAYAGILWLNILYSAFVCIFAKWIILLLYGPEYLPAINALRIVVWYYGISAISSLNQIYLANYNINKYVKFFCFAGLVVNIVLNTLMIPLWGISGAAFATLITQIVIQIIMPALFKDTRDIAKEIVKSVLLVDIINESEWKLIKSAISNFFKKKEKI